MFKTVEEAIQYMEGKRTKRTFLQFQETIQKYQIPTRLSDTIHVAGTNGKGSTIQYLKDILMKHGKKVGTFTSPYMIHHNDRICIDNQPIPNAVLLQYINAMIPMIEEEGLSMFEIDVIIMLQYFAKADLNVCIIETGIGGDTDKTNVVQSDCSVITNVSYDHQEMLGNTLVEIAKHKAGIIKANQVCVTAETNEMVVSMIREQCLQKKSRLLTVEQEVGHTFTVNQDTYQVSHNASYAIYNAKLAVVVANQFVKLNALKTQQAIQQFSYPGRFEKIGNIYLDGAHNVAAMQELVTSIKQLPNQNIGIIFSALQDKEINKMLEILKPYDVLLASFEDSRLSLTNAKPYPILLEQAKQKYDSIIMTGSLHFVSSVRKYLLDTIS